MGDGSLPLLTKDFNYNYPIPLKRHTDTRQRFKHLITKLKHSPINFAKTVVELSCHSNASGFKLHLTKNPNHMRGYVIR